MSKSWSYTVYLALNFNDRLQAIIWSMDYLNLKRK